MVRYLVILIVFCFSCKNKSYNPPTIIHITSENEVFIDTVLGSSWSEIKHLLETKKSTINPDLLKVKINVDDDSKYSSFKEIMKILREEPKGFMVGLLHSENTNYYGLSSLTSLKNSINESSELYEIGINEHGNYFIDDVEFKEYEFFESNLILLLNGLNRVDKPEEKIMFVLNNSDNVKYIDVYKLSKNVNSLISQTNEKLKDFNRSPMEFIYLTEVYE